MIPMPPTSSEMLAMEPRKSTNARVVSWNACRACCWFLTSKSSSSVMRWRSRRMRLTSPSAFSILSASPTSTLMVSTPTTPSKVRSALTRRYAVVMGIRTRVSSKPNAPPPLLSSTPITVISRPLIFTVCPTGLRPRKRSHRRLRSQHNDVRRAGNVRNPNETPDIDLVAPHLLVFGRDACDLRRRRCARQTHPSCLYRQTR